MDTQVSTADNPRLQIFHEGNAATGHTEAMQLQDATPGAQHPCYHGTFGCRTVPCVYAIWLTYSLPTHARQHNNSYTQCCHRTSALLLTACRGLRPSAELLFLGSSHRALVLQQLFAMDLQPTAIKLKLVPNRHAHAPAHRSHVPAGALSVSAFRVAVAFRAAQYPPLTYTEALSSQQSLLQGYMSSSLGPSILIAS